MGAGFSLAQVDKKIRETKKKSIMMQPLLTGVMRAGTRCCENSQHNLIRHKNDEDLLHNQTGGNARWHSQER